LEKYGGFVFLFDWDPNINVLSQIFSPINNVDVITFSVELFIEKIVNIGKKTIVV
jgi:hypothetical protein